VNDRSLLARAIELSASAPPSHGAYSVGCIIADDDDTIVATGYSRELGPAYHAEQVALEKALGDARDLRRATLYTSMEPCSVRRSGLRPCTSRILDAGIARVVFAMHEPRVFVEGHGADVLRLAGVEVIELGDDADAVAKINAHIVGAGE
jgi:pyrimidine deaminase RibD-like protein